MREQEYIFTFGSGQQYEGYCVRVSGTYGEARQKMVDKYGLAWAFQYPASEWDTWKNDPDRAWCMEKEMPF